jgi:hypothetical protein
MLLLLFSGSVKADSNAYNQALEAYNNKNYDAALPVWHELAAEGSAAAQYALGVAYYKGEGVSRDLTASMKWFERAAKADNVQAMFNLGAAYWEGNGTRQSYAEAVEWWKKSATAGQPAAQYNLGLAYYLGKGAEQDLKQALEWISQAAEANHKGAQNILTLIQKELAQIEVQQIETPQPKEVDNQPETPQAPASEKVISTDYQSAVVSGHGGQAYPERDEKGIVLANLAGGTPIKILALKDNWAEVNVPAVANVWVYGKYVTNQDGDTLIRGSRVRARSLPSTGKNSIVVGIFNPDESVILLTERERWKQVTAPPRMALWIPKEQLEIFPNVTTDWLAQWRQALSGPAEKSVNRNPVETKTSADEEGESLESPIQTTAGVSASISFKAAFIGAASAEVLGANQLGAPLLKLLLQGTPIKIVDQRQQWARVQIPNPLNVWVYGQYVNQKGDAAYIQGKGVRARSMPSTTSSSAVLGRLEDNTQVTVVSKEGEWIRVGVREMVTAWILLEQVQVLDQITDDWRERWATARDNP